MDCVVMAGGVPREGEALYEEAGGRPKSLIGIAGAPMVQWVLDALTDSEVVDKIHLMGLGADNGVSSPKLVASLPDQGSAVANALEAAEHVLEMDPAAKQVLLVSGDLPLITGPIVDSFVDQCSDASQDIYYGVVERSLMEAAYPDARRSFYRLRDHELAGADVLVINPQVAHPGREVLEQIISARKNPFAYARRIGLWTLVLALFRRLTLEDAERRMGRVLGFKVRAVPVKHAQLAMDVDKPVQIEIAEQELARR